ncbi:uncharacterized protein Z519_01151 [Cladophialophora bantiana CBS 173.52]|uniref:C2H2-type domain-containing protein n=1 Tax=Cladophialophora bantiana (strain ATCC 10958 / CBS 173.52 / CDC B-1940 / NIH 8579) TaxID=1442370 RepID=A0A0D2GGV7_CLAB1|nr:uncharacterized protein Z519_01151 [Cladophialophora bantiana CBS 173.52]KIW97567.1 hypothetical protein Z519_01151 [Cladophialophora bantiana CBS 173.52]
MTMMKEGYRGHKHSQRDDNRIVKWVQDYDGAVPAAASDSACHNFGSETGLISDLHDECLRLMKELRTGWQNSQDNIDLKPQERAAVGNCCGKLYLWGDILQGGKLEASLEIVAALRQTILGTLVKIGHTLLLGPDNLEATIVRAKNVQARPIEGEQCTLCRKADWQTQRAFVKHLGKHLEDIALLALPLGDDSEDETEGDDPYDKASRGRILPKAKNISKPLTRKWRVGFPILLVFDEITPVLRHPPTSTAPNTPPPQPRQSARLKTVWSAEVLDNVDRSFTKAVEIRDVSEAQLKEIKEIITVTTLNYKRDTINWKVRRCCQTEAKCDSFRPCTNCHILGIRCEYFGDIIESSVEDSTDEESDAEGSGSEPFEIAMDDEKKHMRKEDERSRENAHGGGEHAVENNKGAKDEDEEMHNAEAARPPTEFHSNIIQPSVGLPLSPSSNPLLRPSSRVNPSILLSSDSGVPTPVADPDEQGALVPPSDLE